MSDTLNKQTHISDNLNPPPLSSSSSPPLSAPEQWYIIQQASGQCEIVVALPDDEKSDDLGHWGPFSSKNDAIAKRVGLIRAGKCYPT